MKKELVPAEHDFCLAYEALISVLRKFGKNDPFGEGDFWLVDDNWGDWTQKLTVNNIGVLTREFVDQLKQVMVQFSAWRLMVTLEVALPCGKNVPPDGLIISGASIEEHWDKNALQTVLGSDFRFR
jgi:hypothetical protein